MMVVIIVDTVVEALEAATGFHEVFHTARGWSVQCSAWYLINSNLPVTIKGRIFERFMLNVHHGLISPVKVNCIEGFVLVSRTEESTYMC